MIAGSALSPEKCIVVVHEDKPCNCGGKADAFQRDGRQQTYRRYGKPVSHHRSLRPGHVLKGVARELRRANWFLLEEERYQEIQPRGKIPASGWNPSLQMSPPQAETQT
ncbi:hypothetical protein [uncultured Desulfobacter sp.]|uniref:hypothetical protein n=1 Tax=uncultured Desulfobacter sp. TaxID=240139 RepID=UPI0029F59036|nr:hypothetical protein [uncultured Desulfobacter sp.]